MSDTRPWVGMRRGNHDCFLSLKEIRCGRTGIGYYQCKVCGTYWTDETVKFEEAARGCKAIGMKK